MQEPQVESATVRDAGGELHIECRMSDGQKGAFVRVDAEFPGLADRIANVLTDVPRDALQRVFRSTGYLTNSQAWDCVELVSMLVTGQGIEAVQGRAEAIREEEFGGPA